MNEDQIVLIDVTGLPNLPDFVHVYMKNMQNNGTTLVQALNNSSSMTKEDQKVYDWLYAESETISLKQEAFALKWLQARHIANPTEQSNFNKLLETTHANLELLKDEINKR